MLLQPLEEQLDLPALAAQLRDGERVFNRKVVGQEAIDLSGLKVLIHNKSQCVRILSGRIITSDPDGLVGKDTGSFVEQPGLNDLVGHVVFGACDKVDSLMLEVLVKFLKGDIAPVHQVEGPRFDRDLIHHFGIVDLAGGQQDKCRNRAPHIYQRVCILKAPLPW